MKVKKKKNYQEKKNLTHLIFFLTPITLSMDLSVQVKIEYRIHSFTTKYEPVKTTCFKAYWLKVNIK